MTHFTIDKADLCGNQSLVGRHLDIIERVKWHDADYNKNYVTE